MKRREFITLLSGAAVAVVTVPLVVAGQDYPNRSVTLIVNFPPGGSTDAMARIIHEPLSRSGRASSSTIAAVPAGRPGRRRSPIAILWVRCVHSLRLLTIQDLEL